MANYKTQQSQKIKFMGLLALVFAFSVGMVAMTRGTGYKNSNAASPFDVSPCGSSWNTTDCFVVTNNKTYPIRFAYLIDCYDNTYCVDKTDIITLQAGQKTILGQPNGCSKWQLDFNWSAPDTANQLGKWESGYVVEKSLTAVCNCNYTELQIQPAI